MTKRNAALYPVQVFFDGNCPLCSREVRHYMKKDVHRHIHFIDIAGPGFDAAAYGLDARRVTEVMHAITADGVVHTQVEAFRVIWRALPASLLTRLPLALLRVPGMMALAGVAYRVFARNRYRLTGRCTPESCAIAPASAGAGAGPAAVHSASAQTRG